MGRRQNKYRKVDRLPNDAMSVAQYAVHLDCATSNIYKVWRVKGGKTKTYQFELIEYQGLNFVLPK